MPLKRFVKCPNVGDYVKTINGIGEVLAVFNRGASAVINLNGIDRVLLRAGNGFWQRSFISSP